MTKKDNENFKNSTISWIWDNDYDDGDVKVRDLCHVTGKYRGSADRDCNITVKLSHKIPIVFHNLRNYDFHLTMQELSKFNFKINVTPNGLENYLSSSSNSKLDVFQFLSSSLDSLVKNLDRDDFKCFSQEFDSDQQDLVRQKGFSPYEYMSSFEKFKEQ